MKKLNRQQTNQYNKIIAILKNKGSRLTEVRCEIVKAIILLDHPTITDIIKELESKFQNVNTMSVYNTLDLLLNEHVLFANIFNGKQICYEILTEKSFHLKCDQCSLVQHISDEELAKIPMTIINEIAQKHGMTLDHYKIEAHGICAKCVENNS